MRKLFTLKKLCLVIFFAAITLLSWGQTTVFNDDFSTNTGTTYTTSGVIGSSAWNVLTGGTSGQDFGARRNTSPAQLELTNDATSIANQNGWVLASTSTSAFSNPYSTTLSANSGVITWTLNMRQIRSDPGGFGTTSYGVAFILGGTSTTNNNTGTGYAVVLGQSGTVDSIRLVKYSAGIQGTHTNLIKSNTSGVTDIGAEYLSIKVTYTPSSNTWELFLRNDGTTAFADPEVGTLVSQGTATDNSYTATSLGLMGAWWQGSTGATQTAFFDNVKVKVASTISTTPTVNLSVTSNSASESAPASPITVTATASQAVTSNQTVTLTVSGTNITTGDYTLNGNTTNTATITIPAGSTTGTATFTVVDDAEVETDETVTLTISDPSPGIELGSTKTQNIIITDNDSPPTVNLAVSANTGTESLANSITVTATASRPVTANENVTLTVSGTNITTGDYTLNATSINSVIINIPGGSATGTAIFKIVDDNEVENLETATLTISNPSGGIALGSSTAQNITITDNDIPAPTPISLSSGTYTQDFNTLAATSTSSTLPTGWTFNESGTAANSTYTAATGSVTSGDTYSFGSGSTDRALGGLQSGSLVPTIGAAFTNNSGHVITALTISYTGEQWRLGTTGRNDKLDFQYSINATNLITGNWIDVDNLDFTAPNATGTVGGLDGNASANKSVTNYRLTGISIADGATFFIRWNDFNAAGSDDGLAIDDFSISFENGLNKTASVVAGLNAAEPSTNGTFTVTLNNPAPEGGVTFTYSLSGTSTINSDFSDPGNGSVTIPEGSTSGTITLNTIDDNLAEPNESIKITLLSATNDFVLTTTTASITITDNDATSLFSYTFSDCAASLDGFTPQSITGAQVWSCTDFGRDGKGVQMSGFTSTNNANEDWLISPPINLTGTNNPLLSFYSRSKFSGESLKLYVTTAYTGSVNTTNWTELNARFPAVGSDFWKLSEGINLSAFKQTDVRFAFKYVSTTSASSRWTVDEINIVDAVNAPPVILTVNKLLLDYRYVATGSTSTAKSTSFWADNLTENLTITAPTGYQLSKDGNSFSTTVTYTTSEALNTLLTLYAQFSPSADNSVFADYLHFTSGTFNQRTVFVKGNTYPVASTINVVNWNIEWFGSSSSGQGPTDDDLAQANAKKVMEYLDADVFAVAEIVDTARLGNLTRSLNGYKYVVAEYPTSNYSSTQKLGLVYKTSVVSNVTARAFLQNSTTASSNWSSGRLPFLVNADVTKNYSTKNINFIVIHAKANTGTEADQINSYYRRKAGVIEMKDSLDNHFASTNIVMLGDFNDDLDRTIAPTTGADTVSSYQTLVVDSTDANHYKSLTLPLSILKQASTADFPDVIDHVVISDELSSIYLSHSASLYNDIGSLAGVTDYAHTTSDHYPVMTRYIFCGSFTPEITAGSATTFCEGGNVTLTSGSATGNQWYKNGVALSGQTSSTYIANESGSYTVKVTTNSCTSTASNAISVTVNAVPATPTISAGDNPTTFCEGGNVTLTSSPATTYQWYKANVVITDATAQTYNATESGSYTIIVTNSDGCTSSASNAIVVTENPLPSKPTITPGEPITFCPGGSVVLTSSESVSHLWSTSATTQSITVQQTGNYSVTITDANGCSNTSDATTVTVTDNEAPVITTNGNKNVSTDAGKCSAIVEVSAAATDNCSVGSPAGIRSDNASLTDPYPVGTTTITWSVTDANGNPATSVQQTVTVSDNEAPVITTNGNKNVSTDAGKCSAIVEVSAAATDNCSVGSPTGIRSDNAALTDPYPVGTTTIAWSVTDANGNPATSVQQTVIVTDNQNPNITCRANQTRLVNNTNCTYKVGGTEFDPAFSDNCSGATNINNYNNSNTLANAIFPKGNTVVTWTVRDATGNTSSCSTTITVNSTLAVSIPDVYAVNPGGEINTLYIGYGPTSLTLNASVTGGTSPYSYKWTIGSSAGTAVSTSSSFRVSPTTTTTYYLNVKDKYGCTVGAVTKTIKVVDVRCGPKLDKVTVCIYNKGSYSTSCVTKSNVSGYLSSGSYLGSCTTVPISSARTEADETPVISLSEVPAVLGIQTFNVAVYPNPTTTDFKIKVESNSNEPITIRLQDVSGRVINALNNVQKNQTVIMGNRLVAGTYYAEVIQGRNRKVVRLIKHN